MTIPNAYFVPPDPGDAPYRNYQEYLAHPHFRRIRAEAMRRVDYLCQHCKEARATQVHHLRYPPWGTFDVVENLRPVCYDCHCEIHNKEKSMHGQSSYTPTKQMQLTSLLTACAPAWEKPHSFASPGRYFIDCMAGSGHDDHGNPGSPLILQDYAKQFDYPVVAWCEKDRKFARGLQAYQDDTYTTILNGRYQVEVLNFMSDMPRDAMGLVYLDDNGCKQIWNDDGFLRYIMSNFRYLDIAVHFSEQAWTRSEGAGIDWAERKTVTDVLQLILDYKPASVIYAPFIKHHWRLVYGVGSGKMNLKGQSRIKLKDYIDQRPENQMTLLEVKASYEI